MLQGQVCYIGLIVFFRLDIVPQIFFSIYYKVFLSSCDYIIVQSGCAIKFIVTISIFQNTDMISNFSQKITVSYKHIMSLFLCFSLFLLNKLLQIEFQSEEEGNITSVLI